MEALMPSHNTVKSLTIPLHEFQNQKYKRAEGNSSTAPYIKTLMPLYKATGIKIIIHKKKSNPEKKKNLL